MTMNLVFEQLSNPAVWRGVVYLATAAGLQLAPELQAAIISAGLSLVGVLHLLFPSKAKPVPPLTVAD
jgi:hypothetical protein